MRKRGRTGAEAAKRVAEAGGTGSRTGSESGSTGPAGRFFPIGNPHLILRLSSSYPEIVSQILGCQSSILPVRAASEPLAEPPFVGLVPYRGKNSSETPQKLVGPAYTGTANLAESI